MTHPPLVLGSASPRRREILAGLGLRFTVAPVEGVDEEALTASFGGHVSELGLHLARAKCEVAGRAHPEALVICADTIVVVDDEQLGKPRDDAEAAEFLRRLSGREHQVITALALRDGPTHRMQISDESTTVTFAPLSEADIAWYVASGEPSDKAGGYAIQGLGSLFITGIAGDYFNVVGFPVFKFRTMLAEWGYELREWAREDGL